jgi:hypothetical protein
MALFEKVNIFSAASRLHLHRFFIVDYGSPDGSLCDPGDDDFFFNCSAELCEIVLFTFSKMTTSYSSLARHFRHPQDRVSSPSGDP